MGGFRVEAACGPWRTLLLAKPLGVRAEAIRSIVVSLRLTAPLGEG